MWGRAGLLHRKPPTWYQGQTPSISVSLGSPYPVLCAPLFGFNMEGNEGPDGTAPSPEEISETLSPCYQQHGIYTGPYTTTRLFTASQGLNANHMQSPLLSPGSSSCLLIGSCRMGNQGLRGEKTTNRSLVYEAELKTLLMYSQLL